jgi:hypothetical protein
MGKRKNKTKEYKVDDKALLENEIILYGSTNGWLRSVAKGGSELFMIPDKHSANDEPSVWYLIGKYSLEEATDA